MFTVKEMPCLLLGEYILSMMLELVLENNDNMLPHDLECCSFLCVYV